MKKYLEHARDPISSLTHAIGFALGIVGMIVYIIKGIQSNILGTTAFISSMIFMVSVLLLYFASAYYHYVKGSDEHLKRLRKFDHSMIFVLIVGTYTPMNFLAMSFDEALSFSLILWAIAIFGMIFKLVYINAPRILTSIIYLIMGWAVLFKFNAFFSIDRNCLLLVALGGISYTIGAVIYAIKKPNISKAWGFHELFHIFIMIGTLFHYIAIYLYVL